MIRFANRGPFHLKSCSRTMESFHPVNAPVIGGHVRAFSESAYMIFYDFVSECRLPRSRRSPDFHGEQPHGVPRRTSSPDGLHHKLARS